MLSASLIQLEYVPKQWKSTFSYYPRLSIFSMGHVVNMSNLDLGLLARKIMQAKEKERRGILLGRKYLK